MKTCTKCGEEKPQSEFHRKAESKDGYQEVCKSCRSAYCKALRKKHSRRLSEQQRLRRFGIAPKHWQALFLQQGECCAICKTTEPNKGQWCTDHDHTTGKVRGILCHHCNRALGLFKDNVSVLNQATSYLLDPPYREPDDDRNEDQV